MKNETKQFSEVLERFNFTDPLPIEVKRHIAKTKGKQFKKTLKRAGGYGFLFGSISYLFFSIKKLGLGITVVKSVVLMAIIYTLMALSVITGIYYTVDSLIKPLSGIKVNVGDPAAVVIEKEIVSPASSYYSNESLEVIQNRIGVQPFLTVNVPAETSIKITDIISNNLIKGLGKERVTNIRKEYGKRKNGMMLMGSIELFEGTYTINARLVNVSDSRIISFASEVIQSPEELQGACAGISEKIIGKMKQN